MTLPAIPAPLNTAIGTGLGALGVYGGLQQGGVSGYGRAAAGTGSIVGKLSGNGALNQGAGVLNNVLGVYNGLQQGGLQGYAGAAANGAQLAGTALGNTALSTAGGYVAAPLALYNAVKNWQSGATGSDALAGASAGASIGSIVPGVGTIIGGLVGGAAGALSSAFGPGKEPESHVQWENWKNYEGTGQATQLSPYQMADVFKGGWESNQTGFGGKSFSSRSDYLDQMTQQINNAMKSGAITSSTPPDQINKQIIAPWVTAHGGTDPTWVQGLNNDLIQQLMAGNPLYGDTSMKSAPYTLAGAGSTAANGSPTSPLQQAAAAPAARALSPDNAAVDYYKYGSGPEHSFFTNNQLSGIQAPPAAPAAPPGPTPTAPPPQPGLPPDKTTQPVPPSGPLAVMARGGSFQGSDEEQPSMGFHPETEHYVGNRTGTSGRADDIDAKLANNEYVMDAETVALLGDGSPDAGAKRLDEMRARLRAHKGKVLAKGKFSPAAKDPEQYLRSK